MSVSWTSILAFIYINIHASSHCTSLLVQHAGPCRQFTPELVKFYDKVNKRRKDDFQIVWVSRCRDVQSYGQYFTEMKWLALPPQEAMGERGQWLGEKYGVKSIPSLVLLDEAGNVITKLIKAELCCMRGTSRTLEICQSIF